MKYVCQQGHVNIDDNRVWVEAPFRRLLWTVERKAIIGVTSSGGFMLRDVYFQASGSVFTVKGMRSWDAKKVLSQFANQR